MIRIAVIDAQGGGFGKALVEELIKINGEIEIIALGTNVYATVAMKKAGANKYATGENAICFNADKVDIITGGIGIVAANSMFGEITPKIAQTISSSEAKKVLIPFGRCNITIPGVQSYNLKQLIHKSVGIIKGYLEELNING